MTPVVSAMSCWQAAASAHISTHGLDQGLHRSRGCLSPTGTKLVRRKVGLVLIGLHGRRIDDPGAGRPQGIGGPLAAYAPLVEHDEPDVAGRRRWQHVHEVNEKLVAALISVMDNKDLLAPEERWTGVDAKVSGGVGGGTEPHHFRVRFSVADLLQGVRQSALGKHALRTDDEERGGERRHEDTVPCHGDNAKG